MLLTVLAAFAQEESHSHSENVKWGKRKRVEKGHELLIECYGYRKNEAGDNYEIVPEEAAVVKRIFNLYEKGVSVPKIVEGLLADGIKPPYYNSSGSEKWDESRIHYMITNEKYAGIFRHRSFIRRVSWTTADTEMMEYYQAECSEITMKQSFRENSSSAAMSFWN